MEHEDPISQTIWVPRQPGSTTLPELLEGQAKGTLMLKDGRVYARKLFSTVWEQMDESLKSWLNGGFYDSK